VDSPPEPSEGIPPADTLTLPQSLQKEFPLQTPQNAILKIWETARFCCFEPPSLGHLLQQPLETSITGSMTGGKAGGWGSGYPLGLRLTGALISRLGCLLCPWVCRDGDFRLLHWFSDCYQLAPVRSRANGSISDIPC
jgi:hypothetical protein